MTLGGASVGDYDIIGQMVRAGALETLFYQVAMRPGKPMLAGRYQGRADDWAARQSGQRAGLCDGGFGACGAGYAGVCGCADAQRLVKSGGAIAANNGGRAHYMRAVVRIDAGAERVFVFERQDSSLLAVMERANCLVVRLRGLMRPARAICACY